MKISGSEWIYGTREEMKGQDVRICLKKKFLGSEGHETCEFKF